MKTRLLLSIGVSTLLLLPFAIKMGAARAAHPQKQEDPAPKFSLKIPNDWTEAKDLLGVPLTVLGPIKDGSRPVIQVTDTGFPVTMDTDGLKKSVPQYQADRREWVEARLGHVLGYLPYQVETISAGSTATESHSIGVRYRFGDTSFVEKSIFIVCSQKLYYLKTLMSASEESDYNSVVEQTVRSFTCG